MIDKSFDLKQLNHLEQSVKRVVKTSYDHCIYTCNENFATSGECKQQCFQTIQVPFHIVKHQARDGENHLYKNCLAEKSPNIKQEHYTECTKQIYDQRVEMLMSHFGKVSTDMFEKLNV